jgi:FKBP-type peptidyl-prolyl cis-trans isomerase
LNTKVIAALASLVLIVIIIGAVMLLHGSSNPKKSDTSSGSTATDSSSSSKSNSSTTTSSGLQITDETVGTGATATDGKTLSVSYTGTLSDGTVFDSTSKDGGQPFQFVLGQGQVIKGWDEGLVGMKVGGTRKLVIPPSLGYGAQGAGGGQIPPNATLTFVVQLLGVQ